MQETRREFSAGRPSSLAPPQRLAPGTSARARPASCARRRSSASDRQRGRVTRGSSDAASVLATPLRSNATRTRHGVAVRARPGDAQLRRRRGGARHADDRRALPDRRRVRSRLPVRTRVRLGLEPRRVRGRRLPRRARGRSRPRSAHVGGSRLRAPAVRRVARPGGRPLTRARGLRTPPARTATRRCTRPGPRRAHAGVLRGGERPGRARRRPSGHRGKRIFGGGFAPAAAGPARARATVPGASARLAHRGSAV